jgi:rRNA maturation endonuclease Nob1
MAVRDLNCVVCSADIPLSGDERKGDEIFCTFCGSPFRLRKAASSDDDEMELEEDF